MPVCKWQIEPTNLVCGGLSSKVGHYPKDFTEISNEICTNVIRQLSTLSKHVQDLFRELNTQASDISIRSVCLNSKVNELKERSRKLNPTVDKVSLDDIILCKPFKSGLQRSLHGMGRPEAVMEAFAKLEPIPDLHILNQFKGENEVDCSKLYSDPNFFFLSWCGQIKQEVDRKPTRKKAPAKKKAEVTRKPQNLNLRRIQDRMKNEIIGGLSATRKQEEIAREDKTDRHSQLSSKTSNASVNEKGEKSDVECAAQATESNEEIHLPPPPEPISDQNENNIDGDLMLPPPPSVLDFQKRGTLYFVEDFTPDFQVLPAPPSLHMFQPRATTPSSPVNTSVVPSPPPLPLNLDGNHTKSFSDVITSNAFKLKSAGSNHGKGSSVARQSSSGKDSRNELLSAIRNGIKLRKVDEVRQETKGQSHDGIAGMFDVQMILEMRRRAMQDDDEEEEDDDSECSWDE